MNSRLWLGSILLSLITACSSGGDDDAAVNQAGGTGGFAAGGGGGQSTAGAAGTAVAGSSNAAGQTSSLDYPTDSSQQGIQAFIDAGNYRSATWAAGRTGPMAPPADSLSPHGVDYIWYNLTLRQSKADGHSGTVSDPFGANSMAVKEIYDGSTVIGHAAMLHTGKSWTLFCTASESDRCYLGYVPNTVAYSTGIGNCGCHGGGTVVTADEVPPP